MKQSSLCKRFSGSTFSSSAILLSTPSTQALCKALSIKYYVMAVVSVNTWKRTVAWEKTVDFGTLNTLLLDCGLGKDPHRWRHTWISTQGPEVCGKPLEDFMWAREIIKLNAIKSFAWIFQSLTQCIIKKIRLSNICDSNYISIEKLQFQGVFF